MDPLFDDYRRSDKLDSVIFWGFFLLVGSLAIVSLCVGLL